jgi:phage virion morphogenesis protein
MTGVSITIDDKELRDALGRLGSLSLAAPMKSAGVHLVQSTQRRFEAGTTPEGVAWQPLSAATLARKKGPGILREDGMAGGLMGSITMRAGEDQVEIGSNKVYARIHQLGGKAGKGLAATIPARPYLGLSDADRTEILGIFRDFATRTVKG